MDIAVVIRKMPGGYRATTAIPESLSVDGPTQEEALTRIDSLIREKMADAQVVRLRIPETEAEHPWRRFAGTWKNRPDIQEMLENIGEYRREVDASRERL